MVLENVTNTRSGAQGINEPLMVTRLL